ncbi:FMN-linked oxidoreductase [Leucogyrophana mollusca]|uniref:FMN-linked oxidoreductase n=1 Tax=Leucogyrophana mollusca TaxID=85980 RepID=A0ACB8BX55_9AGAM|nr:FMN-linked oxidoreductase [Leucogyrophana mollusca]
MASKLIEPLSIGALTLRNRVIMSALTRSRSVPTNVPNGINLEYYTQRARGGAGLITTEGTLIVQQGSEWQNAPGIWSKEQIAAWKKITDSVHNEGGVIFNQLWHLGRVNHPDAPEQKASGQPVYAPSAIAARGGKFRFLPGQPGYVTPTAIDDPRIIIAQFRQAAINAKEAGFDGVELHGANGYLVHQFLDSTSNQRTDSYGGSIENRSRFGLEILKELVSIWGNKRVAVRLSPAGGYNDMGMPLQETIDTYQYFISKADELDLAYIALVRYMPAMDPTIDGKTRATQHDVLASYRPCVKNSALFLNGALTPDEASELVASKKIDAAIFGQLWIGHPDLAKRIEHGVPLDAKLDYTTFYGHGPQVSEEEQKKGYTDYPFAAHL